MRINNNAATFYGWKDSKMQKNAYPKTDFQNILESEAEKMQRVSVAKQSKSEVVQTQDNSSAKEKILKEYPFLTEEYLDELINKYDIENMDSDELNKLADELMDKNVIPSYPHENGLHMAAVFPKALYDDIKNGNTSAMQGVVQAAPDYLYSVYEGQYEDTLIFHGFNKGFNYMRYSIQLSQDSLRNYEGYYTESEKGRALQIIKSKQAFYDLMDAIAQCRQDKLNAEKQA